MDTADARPHSHTRQAQLPAAVARGIEHSWLLLKDPRPLQWCQCQRGPPRPDQRAPIAGLRARCWNYMKILCRARGPRSGMPTRGNCKTTLYANLCRGCNLPISATPGSAGMPVAVAPVAAGTRSRALASTHGTLVYGCNTVRRVPRVHHGSSVCAQACNCHTIDICIRCASKPRDMFKVVYR